VARPSAPLIQIDAAEVTEDDGRKTTLFRTENNVRFIRITEPNGFTYWMQEVSQ
jgi:hypothetical protein